MRRLLVQLGALMPFLWITRAQLDARFDELRAEIQRATAFQDEIKYEWALWFNKFRSLYAMLLKREKKPAPEAAGDTNGGEGEEEAPPRPRLSRRGF